MLKSDIQTNIIEALQGKGALGDMPTALQFSIAVEAFASENQCELMESLTHLVEINLMDTCDIPKLLTRALKEKIGIEQGILKPEKALPMK